MSETYLRKCKEMKKRLTMDRGEVRANFNFKQLQILNRDYKLLID